MQLIVWMLVHIFARVTWVIEAIGVHVTGQGVAHMTYRKQIVANQCH